MIHCDKCKAVNPAGQARCQSCSRDLLPGTGVLARFLILVGSLGVAAFAGWVTYKIGSGAEMPDLGCAFTSPIYWAIVAVVSPFFGLVNALRRTQPYERYLERGKRHLTLDKEQALADLNKAVELAPEKVRAPILKERAKLLEGMGEVQQATRDRIASMESAGAYDGAGVFAGMLGADEGKFVEGVKKAEREALLKTSHAVALGWCPKCKAVAGLDEKSKCKLHTRAKIKDIRLALPKDVETVKHAILEERERLRKVMLKKNIVTVLALIMACVGLWYLFEVVMK